MSEWSEFNEWLENFKKEKAEYIVKQGESVMELRMYCPHCGYEQKNSWEEDLSADGESKEVTCQRCENVFHYVVRRCFSTWKEG